MPQSYAVSLPWWNLSQLGLFANTSLDILSAECPGRRSSIYLKCFPLSFNCYPFILVKGSPGNSFVHGPSWLIYKWLSPCFPWSFEAAPLAHTCNLLLSSYTTNLNQIQLPDTQFTATTVYTISHEFRNLRTAHFKYQSVYMLMSTVLYIFSIHSSPNVICEVDF